MEQTNNKAIKGYLRKISPSHLRFFDTDLRSQGDIFFLFSRFWAARQKPGTILSSGNGYQRDKLGDQNLCEDIIEFIGI